MKKLLLAAAVLGCVSGQLPADAAGLDRQAISRGVTSQRHCVRESRQNHIVGLLAAIITMAPRLHRRPEPLSFLIADRPGGASRLISTIDGGLDPTLHGPTTSGSRSGIRRPRSNLSTWSSADHRLMPGGARGRCCGAPCQHHGIVLLTSEDGTNARAAPAIRTFTIMFVGGTRWHQPRLHRFGVVCTVPDTDAL